MVKRRRITWSQTMIAGLLACVLLLGGLFVGVALERSGVLPGAVAHAPDDVAPTFSVFWEVWDLIQQHYVDRAAVDDTRMTYGAIAGMLDSLGDVGHTRFLTPEALHAEEEALAGQFEGIGAHLTMRDGRPTILAPLVGSPAQQAGLRPGDVIVRVDGQDVAGLGLEEVVALVRGPAGTTVSLTVMHQDETTLREVEVVRARITVPTVSAALLPGTSVVHVLITQFAERTTEDLASALETAMAEGATAVVLDMRNNPGGLRDEAIGVASQFLREGNVLIEQDAQGERTEYAVRPGGVAPEVPMVVLVNGGSASAAEIVAGALQDHGRARVVGETTVGTGTVLSIFRLSDGSAVFLGTQGWLTPAGRQIWHQGITPDVEVTLPASAVPVTPMEESELTPEQLEASEDTQLLRALEELASGVPSR